MLHYVSNDARAARRRPGADRRRLRARRLRLRHHAHASRWASVSPPRSARSTKSCSRRRPRRCDKVRAGNAWNEPHDAAVRVLAQGMLDLKLLSGSLDEVLEKETYKRFYMHRTGHWLGLDVHDAGDYKRAGKWRTLAPGMVLTVEPGLYIRAADDVPEAPARHRRAHRGRRAGHRGRLRSDHRRDAEEHRRHRGAEARCRADGRCIRGAGPVGCVLALALHAIRKVVALQGKTDCRRSPRQSPLRPIALSHASRLILERIGAWRALRADADRDDPYLPAGRASAASRLSAADAGVPALGYVVDYASLLNCLLSRVEGVRNPDRDRSRRRASRRPRRRHVKRIEGKKLRPGGPRRARHDQPGRRAHRLGALHAGGTARPAAARRALLRGVGHAPRTGAGVVRRA